VPVQIVWSAEMVLRVIAGMTVMATAGEMLEQPPEVTMRRNQVVRVRVPGR
jgi:hypothetical protein